MKYHIHVYETVIMYETDIEALSSQQAKQKAIEMCKQNKIHPKKPDVKLIAFTFDSSESKISFSTEIKHD